MSADDPVSPGTRARRRWPFGWLGLLGLAWVIFELTHQPALAAVFVCAKFGIEDFRTAGRLARRDADRWRAWATLCLYLAWGLLKIALVALLMTAAFVFLADIRRPVVAEAALVTAAAALLGFALSALLTACGLALAWRGGARLWLGCGPVNRLGRLVMAHALLGLVLVCGGALLFVVLIVPFAPLLLVIPLATLSSPFLLALVRDAVAARVGADRPEECWPEDAVAPAPLDAIQ